MQMLSDKVLLSNVLPTTRELGFFNSIVVVSWNRERSIRLCLYCIISFKSSIVLNCATNGLREALVLRQLKKMNNKEEEGTQIHTYSTMIFTLCFQRQIKQEASLSQMIHLRTHFPVMLQHIWVLRRDAHRVRWPQKDA